MRIPAGFNGVLVNSISTLSCKYADKDGLIRDSRKKLSVIVA